jgi:hypothetical protein
LPSSSIGAGRATCCARTRWSMEVLHSIAERRDRRCLVLLISSVRLGAAASSTLQLVVLRFGALVPLNDRMNHSLVLGLVRAHCMRSVAWLECGESLDPFLSLRRHVNQRRSTVDLHRRRPPSCAVLTTSRCICLKPQQRVVPSSSSSLAHFSQHRLLLHIAC